VSAEAEFQVINEALSIVLAENDRFYVELATREGTDAWCALHPPQVPTQPADLTPAADTRLDRGSARMLGWVLLSIVVGLAAVGATVIGLAVLS
jgi:hypothetical protein